MVTATRWHCFVSVLPLDTAMSFWDFIFFFFGANYGHSHGRLVRSTYLAGGFGFVILLGVCLLPPGIHVSFPRAEPRCLKDKHWHLQNLEGAEGSGCGPGPGAPGPGGGGRGLRAASCDLSLTPDPPWALLPNLPDL